LVTYSRPADGDGVDAGAIEGTDDGAGSPPHPISGIRETSSTNDLALIVGIAGSFITGGSGRSDLDS
jgi:hypothetical protein